MRKASILDTKTENLGRRNGPRPLRRAGFFLLGAALLVAAGCGDRGQQRARLPTLYAIPEFSLLDQRGDTLRSEDLAGQAWAASFVFTHCRGVCPLITARMADVRDSLSRLGLLGNEVRLVSVSTDPARDRPEVLREYAAKYGGPSPEEWAFLTGWSPARVHRLLERGFHVTVTVPDSAPPPAVARTNTAPGYQVNHSPRILVVDTAGRVRAAYSARTPGVTDSVLAALTQLTGRSP